MKISFILLRYLLFFVDNMRIQDSRWMYDVGNSYCLQFKMLYTNVLHDLHGTLIQKYSKLNILFERINSLNRICIAFITTNNYI